MAQSWNSKRRQHERAMDERLRDELLALASRLGQIVRAAATERNDAGEPVVPNRRRTRENLRLAVWQDAIKPYFVGPGTEPLIDQEPQSPFMTLIRDGVEGAVRIQAERQVSIIQKYADPDVLAWLTGRRALGFDVREFSPLPVNGKRVIAEQGPGHRDQRLGYDPWHLFVDPNGYRLSDRGWNTALQVRNATDALLAQQIPLGTSAVNMANMLRGYLWPEASRITTRTPYGQVGSYWARRLARTEISAAAGRSTINAAIGNPFVDMIDWRLSGSHPAPDICDELAAAGPYAPENVPLYPAHPHDLCSLVPLAVRNPAEVNRRIREFMLMPVSQLPAGDENLRGLQGAFNLEWLIVALMGGWFLRNVLASSNPST